MNNKLKTYVLLGAVIAIWGIIGFKMFSSLNPVPDTIVQNEAIAFNPKTNLAVDTFSVQSAKRDPFLGTLYIKKKPKTRPKPIKPKEVLVWPPITYHGAITKQESKTQVFVVSINGQQNLMKVGQEINHIKLVKANTKEILVIYNGQKKTITKV